ncbi:MAG TPA: MFS transporter [Polyangia bacterium]|nr:MFS transporter [Polyangia bacterium]
MTAQPPLPTSEANDDDERRAALWSAVYHFLLLAAYYVIRPLRDAMGLRGAVKALPWLMMATLVAMALATPLFTALVERLPRRRFVPLVYHGFALQLVAFAWLLGAHGHGAPAWAARAFFIWTSVFNLFAVSVFWGFMADRFTPAAAARRYGLVALGGTLGAIAGALVATTLTRAIGPTRLPLVAALLLEAAVFCFFRVDDGQATRTRSRSRNPVAFVAALLRSPLLLCLAGYLLLYTVTSTFAYLEQARLVQAAVAGETARTTLFARMDLWVNIASIALQALATRWFLARLGVTTTLLVLPALTLVGFVALALRPSLALIVGFQVARRTTDYFAARPARELCYVVADRDDKYAAKSFIDTFVYRGGDALGAGAFGLVGTVAPMVALPLCALWLAVALLLGRFQRTAATRSL